MSLSIRVRRKCDGETGVIKSARGSSIGLDWVTVVFDRNIPVTKNANISHFDIISVDTGLNSVDFGDASINHCYDLIKEASDYLDTNELTSICSSSILHKKFKEALK
jgi:hypothetical protein